jgi:hypothetical protein
VLGSTPVEAVTNSRSFIFFLLQIDIFGVFSKQGQRRWRLFTFYFLGRIFRVAVLVSNV